MERPPHPQHVKHADCSWAHNTELFPIFVHCIDLSCLVRRLWSLKKHMRILPTLCCFRCVQPWEPRFCWNKPRASERGAVRVLPELLPWAQRQVLPASTATSWNTPDIYPYRRIPVLQASQQRGTRPDTADGNVTRQEKVTCWCVNYVLLCTCWCVNYILVCQLCADVSTTCWCVI